MADGDRGFVAFGKFGEVFADGVVEGGDMPFVEGDADKQSDNAFGGGEYVGKGGGSPAVTVFFIEHAVVPDDEEGDGAVLFHEGVFLGGEAVAVAAGRGGEVPAGVAFGNGFKGEQVGVGNVRVPMDECLPHVERKAEVGRQSSDFQCPYTSLSPTP